MCQCVCEWEEPGDLPQQRGGIRGPGSFEVPAAKGDGLVVDVAGIARVVVGDGRFIHAVGFGAIERQGSIPGDTLGEGDRCLVQLADESADTLRCPGNGPVLVAILDGIVLLEDSDETADGRLAVSVDRGAAVAVGDRRVLRIRGKASRLGLVGVHRRGLVDIALGSGTVENANKTAGVHAAGDGRVLDIAGGKGVVIAGLAHETAATSARSGIDDGAVDIAFLDGGMGIFGDSAVQFRIT